MHIQNVEFKARVETLDIYEKKLLYQGAVLIGTSHQVDTYFNTAEARLKLRESGGQNSLIHYNRIDTNTAKESDVLYYQHVPDATLKSILITHLGIKIVIDKIRKIYAIGNVRFHLDLVQELGTFLEVEAMNEQAKYTTVQLKEQCEFYFNLFDLQKDQLVDWSYSDLLLERNS